MMAKMHELTAEIREMNDALSDYLREYGRLSGTNEIEGDDGDCPGNCLRCQTGKKIFPRLILIKIWRNPL